MIHRLRGALLDKTPTSALVDVGGVLQERAIALLPGGAGDVDETYSRTTGPIGCPAQGIGQPPVEIFELVINPTGATAGVGILAVSLSNE